MSILIHGMEMPTEDEEFIIRVLPDGTVTTEYGLPIYWMKALPILNDKQLLKVLKTERECVSRDCNRDCANCDPSLDQGEILTAYDTLISILTNEIDRKES